MGLFDKLKSLVSEAKTSTDYIEIIAPLSGEIVNIEDVPDVVFAEKLLVMGLLSSPLVTKLLHLLMVLSVKFLKLTMRSLSSLLMVSNSLFTSVSIPLNLKVKVLNVLLLKARR